MESFGLKQLVTVQASFCEHKHSLVQLLFASCQYSLQTFVCTVHYTILVSLIFVCRSDISKAKLNGDWKSVLDYYAAVFESFSNLNWAFKVRLYLMFIFKFKKSLLLCLPVVEDDSLASAYCLFVH